MADNMKEKNGSSIIGLKSIFKQKSTNETEEGSQEEDDNMEEDEDDEVAEVEVTEAPKTTKRRVQDKFKEKKMNISKPKMTKKLVWF